MMGTPYQKEGDAPRGEAMPVVGGASGEAE
jgi:hypothetical protein